MIIKIHQAEGRKIISICDEGLIGKKFEDGFLQLDVSEFFYKGESLPEGEIMKAARDANSVNIVGKDSIQFALKNKLICEENIVRIKKIPHAIAILK